MLCISASVSHDTCSDAVLKLYRAEMDGWKNFYTAQESRAVSSQRQQLFATIFFNYFVRPF